MAGPESHRKSVPELLRWVRIGGAWVVGKVRPPRSNDKKGMIRIDVDTDTGSREVVVHKKSTRPFYLFGFSFRRKEMPAE